MTPLPPVDWSNLTHDLWVGLGVVVAGLVFALEKRRRGVTDERVWVLVAFAIAFGAIGARLGTWLHTLNPTTTDSFIAHWMYGNRSIIGGLAFAYFAVLIGKRVLNVRWRTGALFAPAIAAGMAVGRIGCLLTELPGTRTNLPWAVTVGSASDAEAWGVPVGTTLHPSFAYEIAFHICALIAIYALRGRLADPADLFTVYLTGYAIFRFGVETVRGNDVVWLAFTWPQIILMVGIPLLLWRSTLAIRRPSIGADREPAI